MGNNTQAAWAIYTRWIFIFTRLKKNIQKEREEEENIWSYSEQKEKQIRLEVLLR